MRKAEPAKRCTPDDIDLVLLLVENSQHGGQIGHWPFLHRLDVDISLCVGLLSSTSSGYEHHSVPHRRSGAGPMSDQYVDAVGQVPGQLQLVDQSRCRLQVRKWLPVGTGTRRQLLALERYRRGEYDLPSRVQLYVDAGRACVTTSLQPVDVPRRILRRRRLSL